MFSGLHKNILRRNETVQKGFKTHHQKETKRVEELRDSLAIALKSVDDVEATRSQDNSEGNPETTVG